MSAPAAPAVPDDYLERVYAGVLGKIIGVYLGRPFEGWTHQRIMAELGPIEYYVHDRLDQPLVVTDDDVSGTFTFVRALEDYGISPDLASADIGRAWLNYLIEGRATLWWGGVGNSTEHTAWHNLHSGVMAPASGAIATNGKTVAEQIGAQIFIDGWALVAPGQPQLAAKLAQQAASVSHDGTAVEAAMLWAAMEAEAFNTRDPGRLLDVGLAAIPASSAIAELIGRLREWRSANGSWQDTRQLIEDNYGYDRYCGFCHVIPNHALMVMALLYAPDDFGLAQTIVNTSGWDTDCNAGNVGCLLGIMLGLDGINAGRDWRSPLADRMLLSAAEGGRSVTDAARISYWLAGLGCRLADQAPPAEPKGGAQLHFALPGSVQGFALSADLENAATGVANCGPSGARMLALDFAEAGPDRPAVATVPTFAGPEVLNMRTYQLMATPQVYPGQVLSARVAADAGNGAAVDVCLRIRHFDSAGGLADCDSDPVQLAPGEARELSWTLPDCGSQPIGEIGIVAAGSEPLAGRVLVDWMRWDGTPRFRLERPPGEGDFWWRAWVNSADVFSKRVRDGFRISHGSGEGMVAHGTRQWRDYRFEAHATVHLGAYAGIAARVQGLRRYYAARVNRNGAFRLLRVRDEHIEVLAETPMELEYDRGGVMALTVDGDTITAEAGGKTLAARDRSGQALADGGIGLQVSEGALSAEWIAVGPPPPA